MGVSCRSILPPEVSEQQYAPPTTAPALSPFPSVPYSGCVDRPVFSQANVNNNSTEQHPYDTSCFCYFLALVVVVVVVVAVVLVLVVVDVVVVVVAVSVVAVSVVAGTVAGCAKRVTGAPLVPVWARRAERGLRDCPQGE